MSAQEYFYTVMDIKYIFFHLPTILIKNALYHSLQGICQLYQPISPNFLVTKVSSKIACLLFWCMPPTLFQFPLLNKSITTLTYFPLFFIMKSEGRTRIITEPWNFLLATPFVLRIQTNSQHAHLTNANCKPVWSSYLGCWFHIHFLRPTESQTSETIQGLTWKG